MQVLENFPLKTLNTFSIEAYAKQFARFGNTDELGELISQQKPALVVGGGSNLLFTGDIDGLVIRNEIYGIEKISEDDQQVIVRVGAGENWHRFVIHCIENGWAGLENLSLIPGCVGASPMQNIGAYGVEVKDKFHELEAWHIDERKAYQFSKEQCEFGYRESVFKGKLKNQFVITHVSFKLDKHPTFHTAYGAIKEELEKMQVTDLSIAAISRAVINIRTSKLPDPAEIGNAGSFFKNPSVSKEKYEQLKANYSSLVGYENADGSVKLAAGWLIEHSGPEAGISWKGYRKGDAGVHAKQALVLVNYSNAKGKEIYELSEAILQSVNAQYGVVLEREVNLI